MSQRSITSFLSDHEIAGRLSTLLYVNLCQHPGRLALLLKPTCAVVLHKEGSVILHYPSGPPFPHGVVSFAFLHDLPAFTSVVSTLFAFSKLEGSETLVKDWVELKAPNDVEAIVAEALDEMKRNADQRRLAWTGKS